MTLSVSTRNPGGATGIAGPAAPACAGGATVSTRAAQPRATRCRARGDRTGRIRDSRGSRDGQFRAGMELLIPVQSGTEGS
jgi:hypothetical protein